MKEPAKNSPPERTPFERFTEFTRRLIAVPKSEIDKKGRAYRRARTSARSRRKKGR
jgi:hypothetical protein